ncbi:tRNA (5-methylaminomethyl-2-thiouridine)(34)-methyltransferase MnmD [Flavobacterium longum]|uniref:tRNA (5-methylaminomethyl-2-thiouridine)(34)-methyltransferase MnmD n=1 Tax=Flavobacterium longum TaxID=1299340 RepID=UPI0039E9FFC3
MKREIIRTEDGSTTIRIPDWDECYHSKHGAIQEAYHVFIKNGLSLFKGRPLSILEIGFGTGLNAFITAIESVHHGSVDYVGVEAYPVSAEEIKAMNYAQAIGSGRFQDLFDAIHESGWEKPVAISGHFTLTKRQQFFHEISDESRFDLIYFDAFGYRVQPELWTEDIFGRMFRALKDEGVLVTYAARGVVKRNLQTVGFRVEKCPGPPGKREMMRGFKEHFNGSPEVN